MQTSDLLHKLQEGVKAVFTSDRWREYLALSAKFHRYSYSNAMLILLQRPSATRVAGFTAWRDTFGRTVNRGEKGIAILAPVPYKVEHEKADGEKTTFTKLSFRTVFVFDVSQTSGKELPRLIDELQADVTGYEDLLGLLKDASPFPVEIREIEGGARGFCNFAEQKICLKAGMSEAQTIKTLIHEMAHAQLHDPRRRDGADKIARDRHTEEVEAESIAFVVSNYLGVDSSEYTFGYVAGWSTGKESPELTRSLASIHQHSQRMIEDIGRAQEKMRETRAAQDMPIIHAPIEAPSPEPDVVVAHPDSVTPPRERVRRAKNVSVER